LKSPEVRRGIAIVALVGGLGMAFWTGRGGTVDVRASLLLTHLPLPGATDGDGRAHLVRIDIDVPAAAGDSAVGWTHTLTWPRGQAPEASAAVALEVPEDVTELGVRCAFALDGADTRFESRGKAKVDTGRADLQVVDIGTCRP